MDVLEAAGHHLHGGEVVVDQDEAAAESMASSTRGAATREEIEHDVAGIGGRDDDAAEDSKGLLSGVPCLFAAVGGHDGVEPGVGGGLAARRFLGTDEASLVERSGHEVAVVMGSPRNIKITTPADMELAEFYLKR